MIVDVAENKQETGRRAAAFGAERLRQAGVPLHDIDTGVEAVDPWGTRVRFLPA